MTSTNKKRILVFTDWYLPGYKAGGPIRSLVNLVEALPHEFFIVTGNKDHHSEERYEGVGFNAWMKRNDNANIIYLDDENVNAGFFKNLIEEIKPDLIYLNSLFSPRFTILPLRVVRKMKLQKKCIVAPRGMLKSGALSIKTRKKKIFLQFAKWTGLYKDITWHATNEEETREIKKVFPFAADIRLSPNLSIVHKEKIVKPEKNASAIRLVCIARISPEKGIAEAIRFLGEADLKGNISCDFIGTQQNADYLAECKHLTEKFPSVQFRFPGEINPNDIPSAMTRYHFFLLASWGENFGHAIAEALNLATPVIISDTTPWKDLEENKAGWVLPMSAASFARAFRQALSMDNQEFLQWSDAAFDLGRKKSQDPGLIEAAKRLFGN